MSDGFEDASDGSAVVASARSWIVAFWAVIALVCALPAYASPWPVLELDGDISAAELAPYIRYAKNFEGEVSRANLEAEFQELEMLDDERMFFGRESVPILITFAIKNVSDHSQTWYVTTNRHTANDVRILSLGSDPPRMLFDYDEYYYDSEESIRRLNSFGSPIALGPGEEQLIAIDSDFENTGRMNIRVLSQRTFFDSYHGTTLRIGAISAGLAVIILLNFILFVVTRRTDFFWISLAELCILYNYLNASGFLFSAGLYQFPDFQYISIQATLWLMGIAFLQFWRRLLEFDKTYPRLDAVLRGVVVFSCIVILIWFANQYFFVESRYPLLLFNWVGSLSFGLAMPVFAFMAVRRFGIVYWPLFVGFSGYALLSLVLFTVVILFQNNRIEMHTWLGLSGLFEAFLVTLSLSAGIYLDSRRHAAELEEKLRLSEEKALADATIRDQNAMLHASGHDTRQVLLAIKSAAHHLQATETSPDQALVDTLNASAAYLDDILSTTVNAQNTLLSDRRCTALSVFSVEEFFAALNRIYRPLFRKRQLKYEVDIEADLNLVSDRALLMRAVSNLMVNSLQHTDVGGLTCRVRLEDGKAQILLQDTGNGIPADQLEAMLDRDGKGSGFRIACLLIDQIGGEISVDSDVGRGTAILLTLPCGTKAKSKTSVAEFSELVAHDIYDLDRDSLPNAYTEAIGITGDQSSHFRARASDLFPVILYKPLYAEAASHPVLKALRSALAPVP